ncbi:malonyl-CoA decarboxylase [Rhodospirillum sp. A1_3_36]|uniref:malonyl-CoA decarboxylase n=1 Tax=Rhodospirillum sp. A1_3_36 TaxID=3391666 RepID=UPI0039A57F71
MTRVGVIDWLTGIADRGRELLDFPLSQGSDRERTLLGLCHDLASRSGEATGTALAREVAAQWHLLPKGDRPAFFRALLDEFSVDAKALEAAIARWREAPDEAALTALHQAAEPARQDLLRRINMAPDGTEAVVDMRLALLGLLKDHPDLAPLDDDLRHLLSSWFNRGFLELRRIDWRTSASVLEKLIRYEAVHEIDGWDDLRRRLAADRRCFAFFHPALEDEPLIFVEIALVKGLASSVQALLEPGEDPDAPKTADTAIFYSISNCQEGLRGISLGNFLIKQVVEELRREMPNLKTFSTLSPIPGFVGWLRSRRKGAEAEKAKALLAVLDQDGWQEDTALAESIREPMTRLCAAYLYHGRRGKAPLDPTARFHLGNGATLERVNWLGDTSAKGLRQSGGMMVNYLYRLSDIERNHEALMAEGKVAASRAVLSLAGKG